MIESLSEKIRKLKAFELAIDVSILMSITDTNGIIKSVNKRFCEVSGFEPHELIGQNHRIVNSGHHSSAFFSELWATITKGQSWHGEIKNRKKNGEYYWVDTIIVPILNEEKEIEEFLSIRYLIDDKKEAELNLQELNSRIAGLFNAIPDMISITNPNGKRIYVNRHFCSFFGVDETEALNLDYNFYNTDATETYKASLASITVENPTISNAHLLKNAAQENKWVLWSETGLFDTAGNLKEILSIGRDITQLKQHEHSLKQSLEELQIMEEINRSAVEGISYKALVKKIFEAFSSVVQTIKSRIYKYDHSKKMFQLCYEMCDNTVTYLKDENCFISINNVDLPKIFPSHVQVRVFKDLVAAENLLRQHQQNKIADYIHSLRVGNPKAITLAIPLMAGKEINGIITLATDQEINDETISRLERMSRQASATLSKVSAEAEIISQKQFHENVLNRLPANIGVFNERKEYVFVNESGIKDPELRKWIIGKTDYDYCRYRNIPTAMADERFKRFEEGFKGNTTEYIEEIKQADGTSKFILRIIYPVKENNKVTYLIGYGIDVTNIKKAEQEKDEHLKQLERIAFTTSHKLRQPIVNLKALMSIIEGGEISAEEIGQIIDLMNQSIDKMDSLTKELAANLYDYKQKLLPEEY